jgi:hypothetical protein
VSRHGKRDILIHFDEEKGELIFYTVSVDDTKNIREKEFDGARIDVPFLSEKNAETKSTGETRLGITPVPPKAEIMSQPEFDIKTIAKQDFESIWLQATR